MAEAEEEVREQANGVAALNGEGQLQLRRRLSQRRPALHKCAKILVSLGKLVVVPFGVGHGVAPSCT